MCGFDVVVVDLEHGAGDEGRCPRPDPGRAGRMPPSSCGCPEGPAPGRPHARRGRRRRDRPAGRARRPRPSPPPPPSATPARPAAFRRSLARQPLRGAGADFRPRADARLACIVQIERASALEAVDAIAALDGRRRAPDGPRRPLDRPRLRARSRGPRLREAAARDGRRGRAPRQGRGAASRSRRPGLDLPRIRLHDALERLRKRRFSPLGSSAEAGLEALGETRGARGVGALAVPQTPHKAPSSGGQADKAQHAPGFTRVVERPLPPPVRPRVQRSSGSCSSRHARGGRPGVPGGPARASSPSVPRSA